MLVLSNALGTTTGLWDPNWRRWAGDVRVLRYDHPGHGGSPVPDGDLTVEAMARGLLDVLDALGIERASFCGVSLGGAVAMWLAANDPGRVERLVLSSSSARFGDPSTWHGRARLVRRRGPSAIADHPVGVWFTPAFRAAHPGVVARYRAMVESTQPASASQQAA